MIMITLQSKPFARVGIAHRQGKEAQAEDQHDGVQHEMLLATLVQPGIATLRLAHSRWKVLIKGAAEVPLRPYVFQMIDATTL